MLSNLEVAALVRPRLTIRGLVLRELEMAGRLLRTPKSEGNGGFRVRV